MQGSLDFDRWSERFAAEWVRGNPLLATRAQYFSGAEQDALDRRLALATPYGWPIGERMAREQATLARRGLNELMAFSPDDLVGPQLASAATIDWSLRNAVANAGFARQRFVFTQFFGLNVTLALALTTGHPLRTARDAENYLARLCALPRALDDGIAEAQAAADAGIVPPAFILDRTIEQIDTFLAPGAERGPLVSALAAGVAALAGADPAPPADLIERAVVEVRERVLPAYARVRALLAEQRRIAGDAAGAWALPDGDAYYARALASETGTHLSAQEIHAIGLREVARIEEEMDALLRGLGHTQGSVSERVRAVNATLAVPEGNGARVHLIAAVQAIVDDAARRAPAAFNLVPAAPIEVRREPALSEKGMAAHYTTPSADGAQPGVYWLPLPDLNPNAPWLGCGLKTTAYHEAIPGHHFQLALELESRTLPYFRKRGAFGYNAAFNEGWALYAERLADESGWYEGDPVGRLGFLQAQLFRARRLVVDTGLHALRWTRAQAIAYGIVPTEVDRYVTWPGQACSYAIGQLRILELRERTKARLGARFSLKAFHDFLLDGGTLPLDVLARELDCWSGAPEKAS